MPHQTIPEKMTITWWVKTDSEQTATPTQSEIEIGDHAAANHNGELLIIYTSSGWSARFKQ